MKLRIKGASLRLRLTQKEVRALEELGQVQEHVPFAPGGGLTYRLSRDARVAQIEASFGGNLLEVRIPDALARRWCTSAEVTLAHAQGTPGGALQITLEKDFACLAPRSEEDESDNFPHPQAGAGKVC